MTAVRFLDELFSLHGRVAVVTGASSGIGERIAQALANAGAALAVVGSDEGRIGAAARRLAANGAAVKPFAADLRESASAIALPERVLREMGAVHVVVNAAGINPRKPATEVTPDIWDEVLGLNVRAPFFVTRGFVPAMREAGYGRIINIASLQSERAFENGLPYGVSKAGVVQLTRAMAQAWSPEGITCNAIAPGFFPTNLTASLFERPAEVARMAAATMIGRNGELRDLDGIAVFLAGAGSAYITGQTIFVDGGWTGR